MKRPPKLFGLAEQNKFLSPIALSSERKLWRQLPADEQFILRIGSKSSATWIYWSVRRQLRDAIVTLDKLAPFLPVRRHRPLFMIDLAMPRDIDPDVRKLDGVYLYDLDSLQSIAEQTLAVRKQESEKCHQLIEHHVQDFQLWIERTQSSNFPSIVAKLQEGMMRTNSEHKRQLALCER